MTSWLSIFSNYVNWLDQQDLNLRPKSYRLFALPLSYGPVFAHSHSQCHPWLIKLSMLPTSKIGGTNGNRTRLTGVTSQYSNR